MTKKFRRKLLFITVFLSILLSYSAYASPIPSVHAAEITSQETGLTILNDVVGLDLTKYTTEPKEYPKDLYWGALPQENVGYDLKSTESKVKLLCTFTDGALHILHVLESEGSPHMTKSATSVLEMAKGFLSNYQSYSGNSFYGELGSMLHKVDADKNSTTTSGNVKLEVTNSGVYTTFEWSYTFDGVDIARKCVALGYKNRFLKSFVDTWDIYKIGSTSINLSEEEAITIAMERARTYSWKVVSGNNTFEINNFNVTEAMVTHLVFCNSLNADKVRGEDLLTLYPMWRIGVGLDKFYPGNVYGIYVDIWADTREVRHVQAVFSTMPPPADKIATINESAVEPLTGQASVVGTQLNSHACIPWIVLPAFAAVVLGTAPVWLKRKKNSWRSHLLSKLHSFRIGGVLFCLLISSTLVLVPVSIVNADIPEPKGSATIWGSLAENKTSYEVSLQESVCNYIEYRFDITNDYDTSNYQGSNTLKANVLSSIEPSEANFHRSAVVWFDHGVGNALDFPGHPDEWHFMLVDSENEPVYDYEIYDKTERKKTFFAFISTCMSAKLDLINPIDGTPLGNGEYGDDPGNYEIIGMPYAWTHGAPLSYDGYDDPDTGDFCYIGFPWGSAALAQDVDPEDYSGVRYYDWVWDFFKYALTYDMSVNDALDHASYECFPPNYFGSTDLHLNFSAIWPDVWGGQPFPNCTMVVYGNGNIHLYQHESTILAKDQYGNSFANKDVYIDLMSNIANTGATIWITGGYHTFFANDFWESSYTGYRYTFYYWQPEPGWRIYFQPVTLSFDEDMTSMVVRFNKVYCPGDVDGDGDADWDDYYDNFAYAYPSERGDSNWDSRCDFNSDDDVDYYDRNYLLNIINSPPNTPSTPSGPTSGYTGTSYTYSTSTTDPDGHNIRYQFNWGDGSTTTGWYASGSTATASHFWSSPGTYSVKVRAQDSYGAWSGWSSSRTVNIVEPTQTHSLTVLAYNQYGYTGYVPLYIDGQYVGTTGYTYTVTEGTHTIYVESPLYEYQWIHVFQCYYYDGNYDYDNPTTLSVYADKTVTAYYLSYYYW